MPVGAFYTPPHVAAAVVARALAPWKRIRRRIRFLDPACGEGVFLEAAASFFRGRVECRGIEIDPAAAAVARSRGFDVTCADALDADWGEFDAVVGNPPWASFSGRQAVRGRFRRGCGAWPSLHGLFLERTVAQARAGARIAFLMPAQVCELAGYRPLREYVRSRCVVEEPLADLGEDAFAGVVQPCCLVVLERREGGSPGDGAPWLVEGEAGDGALLARLDALPRPPPGTFVDCGVHTGNAARRLIGRERGVPIREGRDVHPFRLDPPRLRLDVDAEAGPGEYWRVPPLERCTSLPILLRQTAPRPIAAPHSEPGYFRNSVLGCRGIPGWPVEQVVAWLNGPLVAWWHRTTVRESRQRTFPQVKIRHLQNLPLIGRP